MIAIFEMPSFTERPAASAMGRACGLTLKRFDRLSDGGWRAEFVTHEAAAIARLAADLDYQPTSVTP